MLHLWQRRYVCKVAWRCTYLLVKQLDIHYYHGMVLRSLKPLLSVYVTSSNVKFTSYSLLKRSKGKLTSTSLFFLLILFCSLCMRKLRRQTYKWEDKTASLRAMAPIQVLYLRACCKMWGWSTFYVVTLSVDVCSKMMTLQLQGKWRK